MAEKTLEQPNILLEESAVNVLPEQLPTAITHKNVDVDIVKKYFTDDAWLLVEDVVKYIK